MNITDTRPAVATELALTPTNAVVREGSSAEVTVAITCIRAATISRVDVDLVRTIDYTYSRGNMYGSVIPARSHTSTVIAQYWLPGPGALAADEVSILRQQVHIPEGGPATAHGTIIDVTWSVRARVHGHDIQSSSRRYDLLVTSAAGARGAETELPAIAVDHGRAILEVLNLSSRAIRGGVALTGTLRLLAINDLASRGARVDLIMTEAVSSGPGGTGPADRRPDQDATDCETVVVSAQFPAQHLAAGDEVSLPFSLLAPNPLPAPSLDFDNLHVGWQLRGCLPLLLRQEPTITVQLAGVTAG